MGSPLAEGTRCSWQGGCRYPPSGQHGLLWPMEDEQRENAGSPGRRVPLRLPYLLLELLGRENTSTPLTCTAPPWQNCSRIFPNKMVRPMASFCPSRSTPLFPVRSGPRQPRWLCQLLPVPLPSSCLWPPRSWEAERSDQDSYFPPTPLYSASEGRLVASLNQKPALLSRGPLPEFSLEVPVTTPTFSFWPAVSLPRWACVNGLLNSSQFTQPEGAICFLPGPGVAQNGLSDRAHGRRVQDPLLF